MPSLPDPNMPPPAAPRPVPPPLATDQSIAPPNAAPGRAASPPPGARRPPVPVASAASRAANEEAERLLTRANIQLRRGLTADAEGAVHSLLAARPQDAGAWELLADIRTTRNDFTGARDALQKALAAQPGRATAEVKLGRMVLQISERERMQTLGMAYAGGEASQVRLAEPSGRGSSWAAVASATVPGLGQYLNGEVIKGAIVAAIYFLSLAIFALLPDTQNLLHTLAGALAPGHRAGGAASGSAGGSAFGGFLLLLMTADWLYGIVDAALAARRAPPSSGLRLP